MHAFARAATLTVAPMSVNSRGSPIATTQDVMLVQEAMHHLGLYDGPIDGIPGARTMVAVGRYKRRCGMTPDKSLDGEFIEHLRQTV